VRFSFFYDAARVVWDYLRDVLDVQFFVFSPVNPSRLFSKPETFGIRLYKTDEVCFFKGPSSSKL
jgi:hypothetical protein